MLYTQRRTRIYIQINVTISSCNSNYLNVFLCVLHYDFLFMFYVILYQSSHFKSHETNKAHTHYTNILITRSICNKEIKKKQKTKNN